MIRLGLIGCGAIARQHVAGLKTVADARVAAVHDVRDEAATSLADLAGNSPTVCKTVEQLLGSGLDGVLVCTPTSYHPEPVIAALSAGLHVFCEKPIARTLEDGRRIAEAAGRAKGTLTVGFVRRFDNEWNAMARLVREGRLGRPVLWRSINAVAVPPGWHLDEQVGGGPFLDGMIHNIDFGLQLFGPVGEVWGSGLRWRPDSTAIDTGTAAVGFASGDQLVCSWSWAVAPGSKGTAYQDVVGPLGPLGWSNKPEPPPAGFDSKTQGYVVVPAGGEREPVVYDRNDMFADQMAHFVRTINQGVPPVAGTREGMESLRVALSVLDAMRAEGVQHSSARVLDP